jgi:hypothetical protein
VTTTTSGADTQLELACSFCGKHKDKIEKLIAGPGVYICNECVGLCNEILDETRSAEFKDWTGEPDEELLDAMVQVHGRHEQVDRGVAGMVRMLRERGVSWARIGAALGMTRQSAWERFSGEE